MKRENACRHSCLEGRLAGNDTALDAALIRTARDPEVSLVAPILVPAVGYLPKRGAVLDTPSKNSDGVAAERRTCGVLVNTGLVCKKVLINSESSFHGAIGHDLGLNGSLSRNTEVALAFDLLAASLCVVALGSALLRAARGLGSIDVVIARGQSIGVVCLRDKTAKKKG